MRFFILSKQWLVNSQIFVALCGTLLCSFFMMQQNVFRFYMAALVFVTFINGYWYTKFQPRILFGKTLVINAISFLFCCVIFYFHPKFIFYKWLVIAILGLLYNSFFLRQYIREIPLLKVFYVGLVWALVCSWLVLPRFDVSIFSISFLFVSALVLPFDIRDMNEDNVVTFPKIIGVQNTKYLAYILIFSACCVGIFSLDYLSAFCFYLTAIITFILIYFSENTNPDFYFSVGVESCSLLPFLFLILLK